jgi:hypothetical protein
VEYRVGQRVDAPPERLWSALLEVGSWPEWDMEVTKVEGAAVDGGKIKVSSEVSPGRAFPSASASMTSAGSRRGRVGCPGLFDRAGLGSLRGVIEEHWRASLLQVKELAETEERGRDQT